MQLSFPLVTIVIPTYNRAHLIAQTLQSIKVQTYENWECILVDDSSTDNTKEIAEEFCQKDRRFIYVKNQKSKGAPGARNTGLELAKGEFISFFDSDDRLSTNYIENKIRHFIDNPTLDLVISLSKWIENGKEHYFTNIPTSVHPLIRFYSLHPIVDIPWLTPTLVRKSFLIHHKISWDESIKLHQDIQFNVNLLSKSPNLFWCVGEADWYWLFDENTDNIGTEKNDEILTLKKLIDIYWNNLNDARIDHNLKRRVTQQYHAQLIAFCDKLSFLLSMDKDFIQFVKSRSSFSALDIRCLKDRIKFKNRLPKGLYERIHWKIVKLYFKLFYSPVVKKGNFLTHSTL
jgi:glycosyltransferase involved in cell wall biosynthesis